MRAAHPNGEPEDRVGASSPTAGGEVVLVRHGQGECNAAGVIGGRVGCGGLSLQGRRESVRLARRLAELDAARSFDVLLSSPRQRVLQSAQIIGARLAMRVTVVDALRGQEFGAADGQSWERVIQRFGGRPTHDPDRPIAEGAEAWNTYADRVLAALAEVLTEHAGRRVLLVGHGKTTGLAGALLSGASDPRARATDFVIDHGALSRWRRGPCCWELVIHNDTSHLIGTQQDRAVPGTLGQAITS
jgi:2,3-bisphosphoglycerate-dependent phosphoglycerate mutase